MRWRRTFAAEPPSVPASRKFTAKVLAGVPPEALETAELLVSELATNCVRHVRTRFDLEIRRMEGSVRVEVTDYGGGKPAMRSSGPEDPGGRGLRIVDMLSDEWGIEARRESGKTVWFTIGLESASVV